MAERKHPYNLTGDPYIPRALVRDQGKQRRDVEDMFDTMRGLVPRNVGIEPLGENFTVGTSHSNRPQNGQDVK